jgi:hypothetical protein
MVAAGWVAPSFNQYRAPRALLALLPPDHNYREVRIATHQYFQPSLVFYCNHWVRRLDTANDVSDFLAGPLPSYLFLPAPVWEQLQGELGGMGHALGQHRDFYCKHEIVVVANHSGQWLVAEGR